jgi:hypothetical protein
MTSFRFWCRKPAGSHSSSAQTKAQHKELPQKSSTKIGFYIHLAVYSAVNAILIVINLSTSSEYMWFIWPLIGWGIGVIFHGLGVFLFSGSSQFKEKMVQKELEKQKK